MSVFDYALNRSFHLLIRNTMEPQQQPETEPQAQPLPQEPVAPQDSGDNLQQPTSPTPEVAPLSQQSEANETSVQARAQTQQVGVPQNGLSDTGQNVLAQVPWYRRYWTFGLIFILAPGGVIFGVIVLLKGTIYRGKKGGYVEISRSEKIKLSILAVVFLVLSILFYYIPLFQGPGGIDGYKSFKDKSGTISPVISLSKTSWNIKYPEAMEISAELAGVSNYFAASGKANTDTGTETVVSSIDFRPDSASALGLTAESELGAMDTNANRDIIEASLEQSLNEIGLSIDLVYGGKTQIGVDSLGGYYFAGTGKTRSGVDSGARMYVAYDDDIRFSLLIIGQTGVWPDIGGLDQSAEDVWWQKVVDSVDFN